MTLIFRVTASHNSTCIMGPTYWCHELHLTRSHDVIDSYNNSIRNTASYWCPTGAEHLSSTVFKIFASKYIWITILTFLGHVTSSVTWPFNSPGAISYRWSVTESLSPTVFEIMGIFHIWVTILTFLGHVTSSVTWPIDPPYVISY